MSLMNKKAQEHNYFAVIIFMVVFGFFNIVAYTIWLQFVQALTDAGFVNGIIGQTISAWTYGFRALDYVIVLLLIIFIVGTALASYKLATSTAFAILTFVLGIFWGFVSYIFNYVFIQMVSPSVFNAAMGYFPRTLMICTNLHWVMVVLIIVGTYFLYAKKEQGQYMS
jgi:hypothetical protein